MGRTCPWQGDKDHNNIKDTSAGLSGTLVGWASGPHGVAYATGYTIGAFLRNDGRIFTGWKMNLYRGNQMAVPSLHWRRDTFTRKGRNEVPPITRQAFQAGKQALVDKYK